MKPSISDLLAGLRRNCRPQLRYKVPRGGLIIGRGVAFKRIAATHLLVQIKQQVICLSGDIDQA